ncbi:MULTISPECIES: hypothetical protein [unclassified Endozoicomonas]|uniref:hypothetical protein n=1 Tax=unclassified Endozoicomonas TaxID=2644528 RepID=UPI003BB7B3E6
MVAELVGCDVGKVEGETAELDDSEDVSVGDKAGELVNSVIVGDKDEVPTLSCRELDSTRVSVAELANSEIVEADDEVTTLSSSELDSAGVDIAGWVKSELIEDDEVSVLSKCELDGLTGNDVFVLNG